MTSIPRFMIAAPHGRSGKTVFTLGLLRSLANKGVAVQPFKKGPDYLDTGWHTVAARRESRNLDPYFMDASMMRRVLHNAAAGNMGNSPADLVIVEAAMGLYDGSDVAGSSSSAEVAKQLGLPVILVVDCTRMTRSTAALVQGFMNFDKDVNLAGVLLNRVKGKRQERLVRACIEEYCGIPVVGVLPFDKRMDIPDRHLGLTSNTEAEEKDAQLDEIASIVAEHVDFELIKKIAESAPELGEKAPETTAYAGSDRVKIAVVRDRAFSFYYPENLEALQAAGADLVFCDSMADKALPEGISGLYIGGGFPEVFAADLEANKSFRESVKAFAEAGYPVYAECGGLMYLGNTLHCEEGSFSMCGVLDLSVMMEEARQGHGYAVLEVLEGHPWMQPGTKLVGHEHHHSHVVDKAESVPLVCANTRGHGIMNRHDDASYKNVVAGYTHLHALASPEWAPAFAEAARKAQGTSER